MRVTSEQKLETRKRILKAAAGGFRAHGYGGLGVDGLAKAAGVTSGAFYGHFTSKDEAFLQAVIQGLDEYRQNLLQFQSQHGKDWIKAFLDYYLGATHRLNTDDLCVMAGLSTDVSRTDEKVKSHYQEGVDKVVSVVAAGLTQFKGKMAREKAWALLCLLAGSVMIARSVTDGEVAEAIAKATRKTAELMLKSE